MQFIYCMSLAHLGETSRTLLLSVQVNLKSIRTTKCSKHLSTWPKNLAKLSHWRKVPRELKFMRKSLPWKMSLSLRRNAWERFPPLICTRSFRQKASTALFYLDSAQGKETDNQFFLFYYFYCCFAPLVGQFYAAVV